MDSANDWPLSTNPKPHSKIDNMAKPLPLQKTFLTSRASGAILRDLSLRTKLMTLLGKGEKTIKQYVSENNIILTCPDVTDIIADHLETNLLDILLSQK